uniref:hypothetical protein n=1 Tax=Limnohabitans sp. TaxID=1907725 RepID=UPI0040486A6F
MSTVTQAFVKAKSFSPMLRHLFTIFAAIIILRAEMDWLYESIVLEYFYYWSFPRVQTWQSAVMSWIILISFAPLWLRLIFRRGFSANVCSLLVLMSFIPSTTILSFGGALPAEFWILICLYWLVLMLAVLTTKTPVISGGAKSTSTFIVDMATVILMVNIVYISYQFTGLRLQFDFFDVYVNRTEARTYEVNILLAYLGTAADNVLPVLLAAYLVKKRYAFASLVTVTIFLNFGIASTKQVILLLFVALFISRFGRRELHNSTVLVFGLIALMAACIAEEVLFSTYVLADIFAFRLLFIPSTLNVEYFAFFRYEELDLLRQTAFKFFLDSPYKENIQFMIGTIWIADPTARANNGLFSDAYYNFGMVGVFVYPLLLVFLCKTMEGLGRGLDNRVLMVAVVASTFVFLSVPLTQALFNCGLFVLTALFYLLPKHGRLIIVNDVKTTN